MACHVRILDLRGKQNLHTKGMASFLIITTFSEILLESNPNSRTLKSGSLCICNTSWPAGHYSLTIRSVISHVVPKLCSKEILSLQSNLADANSYPKNTKTTSHVLKKKNLNSRERLKLYIPQTTMNAICHTQTHTHTHTHRVTRKFRRANAFWTLETTQGVLCFFVFFFLAID
jgi:hypothetical protein